MANPNDLTRIKRVTGIPKSFLTPVESTAATQSATGAKKGAPLRKTMISYDGSKVVFTPNTFEWQKFSSMASASKQAAAAMDDPLLPEDNNGSMPRTDEPEDAENNQKRFKTE